MDFDLAKKVTYGRVSTTAFCGSSWFGFAVVWYVNPVYTKTQSLSLLHTQTLQMDKMFWKMGGENAQLCLC